MGSSKSDVPAWRPEGLARREANGVTAIVFGDFQKTIGKRYRDASADNYELSPDADIRKKQQGVLSDLRGYLENLPENIAAGRGLFFYGPVGGGKDHLLAYAMMFALRDGFNTHWENG